MTAKTIQPTALRNLHPQIDRTRNSSWNLILCMPSATPARRISSHRRTKAGGALSQCYDDPAYSGASLERPALQQLLTDIDAGRVNIVVVYKIDRLTRSLADFAKLVEIFDKKASPSWRSPNSLTPRLQWVG